MIITRTPYRISSFGGGTDYHTWYQAHGSSILAATINHYCYLTCRYLPPFFEHKSRVVWSMVEEVSDHDAIKHPVVKSILNYLNINNGVEIQHQGDLPARSGLGSSSAFTVGLLHAAYKLSGIMCSKRELACQAVYIEREVLKENVGVQDQIETAFGGLNNIIIRPDGSFDVNPLVLPVGRLQMLQSHLMLFFTGISRTASEVAAKKIAAIPNKQVELFRMRQMVDEAVKILYEGNDITDFGRLLNESWQIKRSLSAGISSDYIDEVYARGIAAGALGGKVLGAGGGGFMLFFAKPEDHANILKKLSDLLWVPFEFESSGSQVVYFDNMHYSHTALTRRDFAHLHAEAAEQQVRENLVKLRQRYGNNLSKADIYEHQ